MIIRDTKIEDVKILLPRIIKKTNYYEEKYNYDDFFNWKILLSQLKILYFENLIQFNYPSIHIERYGYLGSFVLLKDSQANNLLNNEVFG